MKLTDTKLVGTQTPEGGVNFICDSGINKTYRYRFLVYCYYKDNIWTPECVSIYFNDDMSDELYDAIMECLGKCFFDNIGRIMEKVYNLAISPTQRIRRWKLVDYVAKYLQSELALTYISKLYFTEGGWN